MKPPPSLAVLAFLVLAPAALGYPFLPLFPSFQTPFFQGFPQVSRFNPFRFPSASSSAKVAANSNSSSGVQVKPQQAQPDFFTHTQNAINSGLVAVSSGLGLPSWKGFPSTVSSPNAVQHFTSSSTSTTTSTLNGDGKSKTTSSTFVSSS